MNNITVCGIKAETFCGQLESMLLASKPAALGVATAFLSLDGAKTLVKLAKKGGAAEVRSVIGLSGCITRPAAIERLVDAGYAVRFGTQPKGIFHPKIIVGGAKFHKSGQLGNSCCGYVGSANMTRGGLVKNLEVGLGTTDPDIAANLGEAFAAIWAGSSPYSKPAFEKYEEAFARIQKRRSLHDLKMLDVLEDTDGADAGAPLIATQYASAVWAGLQSYTGEHSFQVEFPKRAGEALRVLLGTSSGAVPIECADGQTRPMIFKYYADNAMYRLNVPNDMPLVKWARENKEGILMVWLDDSRLHAEILRGKRAGEAVARSKALGTWGKTTTREYGWI